MANQRFKFKIFTSSDPDAQYASVATKNPLTFYLLNNGKGYLGETKLFDATESNIASSIPVDATGSTTEAASTKAVVDYVTSKVNDLNLLTGKFFRDVKSYAITEEDLANTSISKPEGTIVGDQGLLFTADNNETTDGNEVQYFIPIKVTSSEISTTDIINSENPGSDIPTATAVANYVKQAVSDKISYTIDGNEPSEDNTPNEDKIEPTTLPVMSVITGTDNTFIETQTEGISKVPFNVIAEFFKDIFMSGYVHYGKELTESWTSLQSRIKEGNFVGIHIGDYKIIQLTTGETVVMEVAGIDQYYRCTDQEIGHHVDFISRDCLAGAKRFNDTDTNNGTAAEPNPWRASKLFQTLNHEATGVYATLPADLKPCIIEKRALLESRFSEAGPLESSAGWAWNNIGKLWLPTEVEVFGNTFWSDSGLAGGGGCNLQYPIFIGGAKHIIKGTGNGGGRCAWWEATARQQSSTNVCYVGANGAAYHVAATFGSVCAPLCFRIG